MARLQLDQQVPVYPFVPKATGNQLFWLARWEGELAYRADMLTLHRKDYYLLIFNQRGGSRHWVDMTPFRVKDNTLYFTVPGQLQIKEEPQPVWGIGMAFSREFVALQHPSLAKLPLVQNPQNGHELLLTDADVAFAEEALAKMEAEYRRPGKWQQRMLAANLEVLLIYLSRLYTEQFPADGEVADTLLLKKYQARIAEHYRELHEVAAYAALLHISAKHLSEVVKAQSGKPAIAHIQERLVLEARRRLFHTPHAVKEIAYDLGFADASYFNRFFKRETGVTPAQYRASSRKMYQ